MILVATFGIYLCKHCLGSRYQEAQDQALELLMTCHRNSKLLCYFAGGVFMAHQALNVSLYVTDSKKVYMKN